MNTGSMTDRCGDRGRILTLTAGPYTAQVASVGAGIESLTVDGRDLLVRNPPTGPALLSRGAIIAPWPNRIGDGTYTWDGRELQVPLSEPERGNALHGLVSHLPYDVVQTGADRAVLQLELFPSPGYPFHLLLTVTHRVDADLGLLTTVRAENLGLDDAPYGVCPHPYLIAGPESLDTWTLQVAANRVLEVTGDRLLPTGLSPIAPGSALDFAEGSVIGDRRLDHALTGLARDAHGVAEVTLTAPGGTGVRMRFDERCPWLQLHTADRPEPENDRVGLAVEPMTCPPDAFRSGTDVVRLPPGRPHEASWSISGW
ncbi:aldose 1-epimerase family protein [Brachybacterium sp. EF45031]|uniref:aldose 1-epimerase family protein n=1 Tax=Brachybacterium sillae TaxID=2810536 RepID=UPI00217D1833|nr:aldose 1-epimerase family protein [Brachybacterium sillae]MCS6712607.1 aldose 1-epimerase family protein [Brachybacterium sillae]